MQVHAPRMTQCTQCLQTQAFTNTYAHVRALSSHIAINQHVRTAQSWHRKTMHMHPHTVFPSSSPISFLLCTQHSIFSALSSLLLPIFVILRPIKALLAYITLSPLSFPLSFVHALTLHLSSIHIPAHTHRLSLCSVPLRKKLSFHKPNSH